MILYIQKLILQQIVKEIIEGKDACTDELIVDEYYTTNFAYHSNVNECYKNKKINNIDLQLNIDMSKRIEHLEYILRV